MSFGPLRAGVVVAALAVFESDDCVNTTAPSSLTHA